MPISFNEEVGVIHAIVPEEVGCDCDFPVFGVELSTVDGSGDVSRETLRRRDGNDVVI